MSGNPEEARTLFIVENGLNTCYIDALLMSLFYKPSIYLEGLLISEPRDPSFMYLQDIMKVKFVDQVRRNVSVTADVMNEIRIYANVCGWKADCDPDELFEQQDVNEFYTFLLDVVNTPLIEIQRQTISEALVDKLDTGSIERIPFISLAVPELGAGRDVSLKELLNSWMHNNMVDVNREVFDERGNKKTESVKALNVYKIMNVPTFIGISLNRFPCPGTRIDTPIDIQKKIKLHHVSESESDDGLRWSIHALICHRGETAKRGHYYAVLVSSDSHWLLFDDQAIPCMREIDIKNSEISETVKREIVFAIYCYDETS